MNKGFTLLVSLVVLAAMGLVMFSHIGTKEAPRRPVPFVAEQGSQARQGGFATPLNAPQGDTSSLRSIEPPISNMTPPAQPDGVPQPVRLTPSFDGNPPQSVAPGTEPSAATTAAPATDSPTLAATFSPEAAQESTPPTQAPTTTGATGKPGLTPWEKLPQEVPATPPAPSIPPTVPQTIAQTTPPAAPQPTLPTQTQNRPVTAPVQTAQATLPPTGSHSLRNISLSPSGQGLVLQIEADSPFRCNAFVLTGPDRLVVDLPGTWQGMRAPPIPENRLVRAARLGQQPAGPRLVLDLAGPIRHTIERSGNTTRIILQ